MTRNRWVRVAALAAWVHTAIVGAQIAPATSVQLSPVQDAFTRFVEPTLSYGDAGAMHVAGGGAGNADGVQQGVAEAWIQFHAASAVEQFDFAFGFGNWTIESVALMLSEVGAPKSSLFSRGTGAYAVEWVANDNWSGGAGKPRAPGLAGSITLGFDTGRALRDPAADESIGSFANSGVDQVLTLDLEVTEKFAADIMSGGLVTLNLISADPRTGFTFHSSNRKLVDARQPPVLTVTAVPLESETDDDATEPDNANANENANDNGAADDGTVDSDNGDSSHDDMANTNDNGAPDDDTSGDMNDGSPIVDDPDDGSNEGGASDDATDDDSGDASDDDAGNTEGGVVETPLFNCGPGAGAAMILSVLALPWVGAGGRRRPGPPRG